MRSGSGNLVVRPSERKPVFFALVALILLGGIGGTKRANGAIDGGIPAGDAGAFDASAPPSGAFSALVGIVSGSQLTCTGILVEARLVVTAASCVTASPPTCLAISGVCVTPPKAQIDPGGQVAAFVLSSDALAEPVTYGRGEIIPVAGDTVSIQGYEDSASLVATVIATDATTDTAILGSNLEIAAGSFQPTDLGAPLTFTPPATEDGTVTTGVYGILVTLPPASSADAGASSPAVFARLDTLAQSFLDPLVQNTRTEPDEGCR